MSEPIKPLPCPFCGEPAETDTQRGYSQWPSGQPGTAIAVYCTKCPADMTLCKEDHRGEPPEYLLELLVEAWNKRAELASLRAENERLKAEAAAMREALMARQQACCEPDGSPDEQFSYCESCRRDMAALSSSTASDYVSKSDVLQIAEELRYWAEGPKHVGDCEFSDKSDEGCWLCMKADRARWPQTAAQLALARKLGVLEGESERLKAEAAGMRNALTSCLELMDHARGLSLPSYTALHNAQGYARAALSSTASDYVSKSDVQQIAEALEKVDRESAALLEADDSEISCDLVRHWSRDALALARKLGMLEDK